MFKPTHLFMFGEGSVNNKRMFPKGIPVQATEHGCDGETLWLSDDKGNSAGWANKNGTKNYAGSFVVKL